MNIHFAGLDAAKIRSKWLREIGVSNLLESFYSLNGKPILSGFNTLLDSGGFVARSYNIKILVQELARYINKNNIEVAFELDTNDRDETLFNRAYLHKHTAAQIIPIYHYSTYAGGNTDDFKKLLSDYNYIALGGCVNINITREQRYDFMDYVFYHTEDKIKVHGLGINDLDHLKRYPFYSGDASTWLDCLRFGNFSGFVDQNQHEFFKKYGTQEQKLKNELLFMMEQEKYITKLWEKRGIKW